MCVVSFIFLNVTSFLTSITSLVKLITFAPLVLSNVIHLYSSGSAMPSVMNLTSVTSKLPPSYLEKKRLLILTASLKVIVAVFDASSYTKLHIASWNLPPEMGAPTGA